jgi:hypothetical protein
MRRVLRATVALFGISTAQSQQVEITSNVMIPGTCRVLTVAGRPAACTANPHVIYTALSNGRVMYGIGLEDGRVLGFVGESDRQPRPEEYWLYLARVRVNSHTDSLVLDVGGTCRVAMTADGLIVHRIHCSATDTAGKKFTLDFRGIGRPVIFLPDAPSVLCCK